MPGRSGRFGRADRLRKSRDFRRVSASARRQAGPLVVVLHAPRPAAVGSDEAPQRLGLTVSRKVGGAVVRNRVKRHVREWFRVARHDLPAGTDWVVIARTAAHASSYAGLCAELDRLCLPRRPDRG